MMQKYQTLGLKKKKKVKEKGLVDKSDISGL